jgi:hypothetical protein
VAQLFFFSERNNDVFSNRKRWPLSPNGNGPQN